MVCVYVCGVWIYMVCVVCAYICVQYVCTCMWCVYVCVFMVCVYICNCVYTCTCVPVYTWGRTLCVLVYMHVCGVCVCVCGICVYVWGGVHICVWDGSVHVIPYPPTLPLG